MDPAAAVPAAPVAAPAVAPERSPRFGRAGRGLTHELVQVLGAQLRDGAIKPGDKLPAETVIMQTFGVSRGVVREAISKLQAAGLVQTHHGIGTFALETRPPRRIEVESRALGGIDDLLDMLELRTSVESDAAGLAALRHGAEDLNAMREALADFSTHLATVGETVAPDFRFHFAIAQATGNRHFCDLMRQLGPSVIPHTRVSTALLDDERRARHLHKVHQEHQDIFAAIERRDPQAARAAMRIHLINSRERQRLAHAARPVSAPERGDGSAAVADKPD